MLMLAEVIGTFNQCNFGTIIICFFPFSWAIISDTGPIALHLRNLNRWGHANMSAGYILPDRVDQAP